MSKRRDMPKIPDELIEAGFKLRDELSRRFLERINSPWHPSGHGRAFEVGHKILTAVHGPKKRPSPKKAKVLRILRKHPERRTDLIAKKVGCTTSYVNQLRKPPKKKRN